MVGPVSTRTDISRLKGPVFYQLNYDPIKLVGAAWIQTRTDLVKGQAYCRLYYAPKKWNRKWGMIPRAPVFVPATTEIIRLRASPEDSGMDPKRGVDPLVRPYERQRRSVGLGKIWQGIA